MTTIKTYSKIADMQAICEALEITIHVTTDYLYFITKSSKHISNGFDNVEEAYGFIQGYNEVIQRSK